MLLAYLKRHYKIIILLCAFTAIFALVFYLYRLPLDAVVYATVLCFFIGIILFLFGFWRHVQRHRMLTSLFSRITMGLDELPQPQGLLDQDYQQLIRILYDQKTRIESAADNDKSELVDYYTLWAHQIKTPIAAIKLLLQSNENRQNAELLVELFKIEQYVEMVLQYLRIESTSNDFILRNYQLDEIVRQAVRKYAQMFILKKIKLNFQPSGITVLSDEKWLTYVIEQILSNALKYTAAGSIAIYTQGNTLIIEDSGIGIRAEDLPRVFEKGFTGYNGRSDKKSTGIGLYLTKRILDKLGHTITLKSEVGKGTKVTIGLDTVALTVE